MSKHKHYDYIVAWAAGETIEYFDPSSGEWRLMSQPSWNLTTNFRIQPKELRQYYRISKCTETSLEDYGCQLVGSNLVVIFDPNTKLPIKAEIIKWLE